MKNFLRYSILILFVSLVCVGQAQVSAYSFSQASDAYQPITGGALIQSTSATASIDDNNYTGLDIGFTFNYAGADYTTFSINGNGFIALGNTISSSNTPLSTGATNNVIAPLGVDLIGRQFITGSMTLGSNVVTVTAGSTIGMSVGDLVTGTGIATGSTITAITPTSITLSLNVTSTGTGRNVRAINAGVIRYETVGTAPNRKLVVQWSKFSRYATTAPSDLINMQIILEETSNVISVAYDIPYVFTSTNITPQVGLRGASNLDFNNRTTTSDWSLTNAGALNTATCTFSSSVFPSTGQIFIWTPPSCAAPGGLVATITSLTSANLTWSAAGSAIDGYDYYVSTVNTAPTAGTIPTGSTMGSSVSLTGLTANTTYYFWVRSNCGSGTLSNWSTVLIFYTGYCLPSSTSQSSWVSVFNTSMGMSNFSYTAASGTAGGYNNQFGNFIASNYVGASTSINMTAGGPTCGFAVWIDWNNNFVFEASERVFNTTSYVTSTSGSFLVPIGTPNGSYRMRVVTDYNSSNPSNPCATITRGEFVDFTFDVVDPPSCLPPTALVAAGTTLSESTVSWTAPSPAPDNGYQFYVSTSAGSPAVGTTPTGTVAAGTTSVTVTGLNANTTYYVFVASVCGSIASPWSSATSFFTGYCVPGPISVDGTGITNVTFGTINNTTGAEPGNYGDYSAQSNNVPQSTTATVLITYSTGYTYDTKIWVDWNDDLDFTDVGEEVYVGTSLATNPTTLTASFTVPLTAPLGAHRMRIGGQDVGPAVPCYTGSYGTLEDYTLNVIPAPNCLSPTALSNTAVNTSGATISWTAPSPAPDNGYQYFVSTTAGSPAVGATPTGTVTAGTTSVVVTGLNANTTYYVFVASVCGAEVSPWSSSTSFYTGYCVPNSGSGCQFGDLIANVTLNTLANNTGTICTAAYNDYTENPGLTTTLLPSSSYNCVIGTGAYAQSFAVWIDYNDDLIFDASERVGYTINPVAANSTANFPIVLSCNPPAGNHVMRVRSAWDVELAGINVTPCGTQSYGEVEDYLITIAPAPTCPAPGQLSLVSTTTTTANLTWNMECSSATNFDFEYGPSGFVQGTGTLVSNVSATINAGVGSYTLTGLTPNTGYSIYFRANCGGGDVSPWSLSTNAISNCAPISLNNPGNQTVCNSYTLPTITETTLSGNAGLVLQYRTQPNGAGTIITSPSITSTQTVYIYASAGSCTAEQSFIVTVNNSNSGVATVNACNSYTWIDGNTYTSSTNTPTFTLTNAAGCDSVVTLNLTINNSTTGTAVITACDSYTWIDGVTYTSSTNTPSFILTSSAGCDSVVTLNLTVNNSNIGTATVTACDSYTWIDGNTYTSSTNTPTFTLTNATGCDSLVTLNLTINNSTTGTDVQTACETYTWIDGVTYTSSTNTPTFTLTNAAGCDSIITLNLTINTSSTGTDVQSACDSYTWIDGNTYTSSTNTPTFTLTNVAGCDSIVTLNLSINSTTSSATQAACESYTWNGQTYTQSGTYTFTSTNANGCDSIATLILTINALPTASASGNGEVLTSSTASTYQWIDCATNSAIQGATSQTYTATENGSYAVIVTNASGCSDTSNCVIVETIGLNEFSKLNVLVNPNPSTGIFNIDFELPTEALLTVLDASGRVIQSSIITNDSILDLTSAVTGIYYLQINSNDFKKVIRIVKN